MAPTMNTRVYRAYRVLGLTPGAPRAEVTQAHRDLAQVWHPDRFGDNARLREKAERNLQRINEAYEVLSQYDPPPNVRVSRLTTSFSAILDLGDLVQGTAPSRPVLRGRRRTILGLSAIDGKGGTGRTFVRVAVVLAALAAIAVAMLLLF